MSEEKKVIHEVKLDKSIIKLLWVFGYRVRIYWGLC